jgi:predicted lipid-binding transport protein (Tim44 family)
LFDRFSTEIVQRGKAVSQTVFFNLQTELAAYDQMPTEHCASVFFKGQVQETADAEAVPFEEVWNLSRPINDQSGWVLVGIQAI